MPELTWARTIAGEARGEPGIGRLAVAFVPWNRSCIAGTTVAFECLKPWQFSCWNAGDPNKAIILGMTEDDLASYLALIAQVKGGVDDPSHGATFYHVDGLHPPWALDQLPCAVIGKHVFYKNIAPYTEK